MNDLVYIETDNPCPECGEGTYDAVMLGEIPERYGCGCRHCGWGVGSEGGEAA